MSCVQSVLWRGKDWERSANGTSLYSMLVRAFRGDQEHRYAVWRRVKLKKEILRRVRS